MASASENHAGFSSNESMEFQVSVAEAVQVCEPKRPTTFHKFRKLAQETQDAIWKYAVHLAEPRVVELFSNLMTRLPNDNLTWTGEVGTTTPTPGLLQACQRSRQFGLSRWSLAFARDAASKRIFFDFNADTLYFGVNFVDMGYFSDASTMADRSSVRKITFHPEVQQENEYYDCGEDLGQTLQREFLGVEEIIFINNNVDFDTNIDTSGDEQAVPYRKKTVVTFEKAVDVVDESLGKEVVAAYEMAELVPPKITYLDYKRSCPNTEGCDTSEEQDELVRIDLA
jgi:hypothetical protein